MAAGEIARYAGNDCFKTFMRGVGSTSHVLVKSVRDLQACLHECARLRECVGFTFRFTRTKSVTLLYYFMTVHVQHFVEHLNSFVSQ